MIYKHFTYINPCKCALNRLHESLGSFVLNLLFDRTDGVRGDSYNNQLVCADGVKLPPQGVVVEEREEAKRVTDSHSDIHQRRSDRTGPEQDEGNRSHPGGTVWEPDRHQGTDTTSHSHSALKGKLEGKLTRLCETHSCILLVQVIFH